MIQQSPVIAPVYQYHADRPWRNQYSSNPDIGHGWTRDPLTHGFFAFGETPGAVPVYQYHTTDSRFQYAIADDIGGGWTRGVIAFHAFEKAGAGTIPVYQFRAENPRRYIYSTNPEYARPDWVRDGVVFHVFAAVPAS
jgi:hypothetical protein